MPGLCLPIVVRQPPLDPPWLLSLTEYTVGTSGRFHYQALTPGPFVSEVSSPAASKDVSPFFVAPTWAWFCQVPMETESN